MMTQAKNFKTLASVVAIGRFKDRTEPFTFYSRDIDHHFKDETYWVDHLRNLLENKWSERVEEYAIYRLDAGSRVGDPLVKVKYLGWK